MRANEWTARASGVVVASLANAALAPGPIIFYALPVLLGPITSEFGWGRGDFLVVTTIAIHSLAAFLPLRPDQSLSFCLKIYRQEFVSRSIQQRAIGRRLILRLLGPFRPGLSRRLNIMRRTLMLGDLLPQNISSFHPMRSPTSSHHISICK